MAAAASAASSSGQPPPGAAQVELTPRRSGLWVDTQHVIGATPGVTIGPTATSTHAHGPTPATPAAPAANSNAPAAGAYALPGTPTPKGDSVVAVADRFNQRTALYQSPAIVLSRTAIRGWRRIAIAFNAYIPSASESPRTYQFLWFIACLADLHLMAQWAHKAQLMFHAPTNTPMVVVFFMWFSLVGVGRLQFIWLNRDEPEWYVHCVERLCTDSVPHWVLAAKYHAVARPPMIIALFVILCNVATVVVGFTAPESAIGSVGEVFRSTLHPFEDSTVVIVLICIFVPVYTASWILAPFGYIGCIRQVSLYYEQLCARVKVSRLHVHNKKHDKEDEHYADQVLARRNRQRTDSTYRSGSVNTGGATGHGTGSRHLQIPGLDRARSSPGPPPDQAPSPRGPPSQTSQTGLSPLIAPAPRRPAPPLGHTHATARLLLRASGASGVGGATTSGVPAAIAESSHEAKAAAAVAAAAAAAGSPASPASPGAAEPHSAPAVPDHPPPAHRANSALAHATAGPHMTHHHQTNSSGGGGLLQHSATTSGIGLAAGGSSSPPPAGGGSSAAAPAAGGGASPALHGHTLHHSTTNSGAPAKAPEQLQYTAADLAAMADPQYQADLAALAEADAHDEQLRRLLDDTGTEGVLTLNEISEAHRHIASSLQRMNHVYGLWALLTYALSTPLLLFLLYQLVLGDEPNVVLLGIEAFWFASGLWYVALLSIFAAQIRSWHDTLVRLLAAMETHGAFERSAQADLVSLISVKQSAVTLYGGLEITWSLLIRVVSFTASVFLLSWNFKQNRTTSSSSNSSN